MAADNRRIITGTHIIPQEGHDREESVGTKWILDTTVDKTLGGKSTVTDINATQWHIITLCSISISIE